MLEVAVVQVILERAELEAQEAAEMEQMEEALRHHKQQQAAQQAPAVEVAVARLEIPQVH